jgi:uncharacterized protein YjdB
VVLYGPSGDSVVKTATFDANGIATLEFEFPLFSATRFRRSVTAFDERGAKAFAYVDTIAIKPGENTDLPTPQLVYAAPDAGLQTLHVAPSSLQLNAGGTGSLGVNGTGPGGAPISDIRVGWTSRDPSIATVEPNGGVRAGVLHGATYIVATTYVDKKDSALVRVRGVVDHVVTAPASLTIPRGGTGAVTAEMRDAANHLIDDRTATFSSSSDAIATVTSAGVVRGVAVGTATITATSDGKTGAIPVTVVSPVDRVELTPAALTFTSLGESGSVAGRIVAVPGGSIDGIAISYASANAAIATVDASGNVTARGNGTTTITAAAENKTAAVTVTVRQEAASIAVTPSLAGVTFLGDSRQFSAVAADARGNPITAGISWSSSDAAVASVNESGVVVGKARGSATITAAIGNKTATASFTVAQVPVGATIVGRSPIRQGNTQQLQFIAVDAGGSPVPGSSGFFTSSNPAVVAVTSGGFATAVSAGSATITANAGTLTASMTITVLTPLGNPAGGGATGQIIDASTGLPIAGASVAAGANAPVVTGADGSFTLSGAADGTNLTISAPGFIGTTYFNVAVQGTATTNVGIIPLAPTSSGTATISGRVVDAVTGSSVVGATLIARSGVNATSGSPVIQITTGANGYVATLPAGTYTVSGSASGYIPGTATIAAIGGASLSNQNIVATPVGSGNTIRIVLTWGAQPRDLDSHMFVPAPCSSSTACEVAYYQRIVLDVDGTTTLAQLDQDVTGGFGPETITIPSQRSGTYTYFVHHFSGSQKISTSPASVKVFRGSQQIAQFSPPANAGCGGGDVWNVFTLNGNTITPVNTVSCAGSSSFSIGGSASRSIRPSDADRIRAAAAANPKKP